MSSILDLLIADLKSETLEYSVDLVSGIRLWFKRDSEYSDHIEKQKSVEAQFDSMTEYDDEGNFKKYKGTGPGWMLPRRPEVLRQCIGISGAFIRAESQVIEGTEYAWKRDPSEWGLGSFLKLAHELPVVFAMLCDKVYSGQVAPIIEGEARRVELAKKNLEACQIGGSTSASGSESESIPDSGTETSGEMPPSS